MYDVNTVHVYAPHNVIEIVETTETEDFAKWVLDHRAQANTHGSEIVDVVDAKIVKCNDGRLKIYFITES